MPSVYPHPLPAPQTDFQPQNPKAIFLSLVLFSVEEFEQITSICVWKRPMGKGPRRIYSWQNTNIDLIKHREQRALMLPICSPGTGNLLIAQHLPSDALYLQMPHVAQYLTRGGEWRLAMLVDISYEATCQCLDDGLCFLKCSNDKVMDRWKPFNVSSQMLLIYNAM